MNTNIGNIDRIIRLVAGTLIVILGIYYQSWWGAAGLIPLVTGAIEYCPLYSLLGISTSRNISRASGKH